MPIRCRLHGLGQRRQAALALEPRFLLISDHGVPTAYLRVLKNRGVGASNLVAEEEPRIALAIAAGFRKMEMGHTAYNLRCAQLGLKTLIRRLRS